VVVAAGLAGLAVAGLGGKALQPKPAEAAQTTIDRNGVNLNLEGRWHSRTAPRLPGFHLKAPIAAVNKSRATIVVGRSRSAGPQLVTGKARFSLPKGARNPQPVLVGEHAALRYGPASLFNGVVAVEVLALPLAHDALVVRCTGPRVSLPAVCAQAAADLQLDDGSVRGLAPTVSVARQLRAAVSKLSGERQRQRSLLASTKDQGKLSTVAGNLARASRSFASSVASLPSTAQDAQSLESVVRAARLTEAAYTSLAQATTSSAWSTAQAQIDRRERLLGAAIRRLGESKAYGS
jgi:hypothetical protein